jgi:hypothetical protein
MNQSKAEKIVARLLSNSAGLQYGQVSVCLKIHSGRIVDVTYSTTENLKEIGIKEADGGETTTGQ